jgi:hypothetical protein
MRPHKQEDIEMARPRGFEPLTYGLEGRHIVVFVIQA